MILKINDRIRTRQLEFFNQFKLSLKFDSVGSVFSFDYYFDPNNTEHKELSCIGHFHTCTIEHNDELLVTGQVLSINFTGAAQRQLVSIGGYALPGILEDCDIPPDTALQTEGLNLRQIAQQLCNRFGLKLVVDAAASAVDEVFDITTAKDGQNIKSYLTELAAQKDIVISHTAQGALLFTKAVTKNPIFDFDFTTGAMPGTNMVLNFNGQAMHSHITVRGQADVDAGNASESTVRNPYVFPEAVYRPKVITQSSGTDIDSDKAARHALAAELKNLKLTIQLDRWIINGKIIRPGNYITVLNPEIYLYKKSTWFIEQVDFAGNEKEMIATLQCVLPEVYNGQTPEYLFKGINLH